MVEPKVRIHSLFATPIIQFKFKNHEKYYFEDVEKSVNKPDDWHVDLNTSFPKISDNDLLIKKDIKNKLRNDLANEIFDSLVLMNLIQKQENISFHDFWYNIYHSNQGQELHWHMPRLGEKNQIIPLFSGIYYNKNSNLSKTIFTRTDAYLHKLYNIKEFENTPLYGFMSDENFIDVLDGDIILFPPYLRHRVELINSESSDMRLTFAFNIVKGIIQ